MVVISFILEEMRLFPLTLLVADERNFRVLHVDLPLPVHILEALHDVFLAPLRNSMVECRD